MTAKCLFIIIVLYLENTNSQYYSQAATSYQPYNYYPTAAPSMASYPSMYTPQPVLPPSPYSTTPTFTTNPSIPKIAPSPPNYAPSTFAPMPFAHTSYQQSSYAMPAPFSFATPPRPTYAPGPVFSAPYLPTTVLSKPISSATQKRSPPTATAYYLTTLETPTAVMKKRVEENVEEKLPAPTYPCPFCTGFANVPKNSKVPPPPPCASVLPGILDKIPTISIPDELKIKELGKKLTSPPLLADLLEHKLSGKLRFDQDVLDGFLTGLGLGICND